MNLIDFNFEIFQITFFVKYRGGQIVPLYTTVLEKNDRRSEVVVVLRGTRLSS